MITHERAREAARRLIAAAFRGDGEYLDSEKRPRFSIPARPDEDDDLVLCEYIRQQASLHDQGIEAAARWHEGKAEDHELAARTEGNDTQHDEWARHHRKDAAALRAALSARSLEVE